MGGPVPAQVGNDQILDVIESEACAMVFRVRHRVTMAVVALKAILKRKLQAMQEVELLQRDVNLMKIMDDPFITCLFCVLDDEDNFLLMIEFVPHRHLRCLLGGQVRLRRLVRLPGRCGRPTNDRQRLGRRCTVEWGCSQRLR
jgi:serine/threonine protein kinase